MWGIVFFGVASGILLDVLVGLLGSRRDIGFGWSFLISVIFTPVIGVIAVLLSPALPAGAPPKYGCLGRSFGCLGAILMILITTALLISVLTLLLPIV